VNLIKYLTKASYENFDQLKEGMPEGLFAPEQYMEIIINVRISFCYLLTSII
jgi:hypothetical protein